MKRVIEVQVPIASKLFQALNKSNFHDAYQVSLQDAGLSVQDAYRAVFGHVPQWVRALFAVRGVAARVLGLHHPTRDQFRISASDDTYRVGQPIELHNLAACLSFSPLNQTSSLSEGRTNTWTFGFQYSNHPPTVKLA